MLAGRDCFCSHLKVQKHTITRTFSRVRLRGFRGPTLCLQPSERTQFSVDHIIQLCAKSESATKYIRHISISVLQISECSHLRWMSEKQVPRGLIPQP
jgi:hypothetical protein